MTLRTLEIQQLNTIGERNDLLPDELKAIGVILAFDILYDAEVFTEDESMRGGTWGTHFSYGERRQANVKLQLNGYLEVVDRVFRTSTGRSQTQLVYHITAKGRELLRHLKDAAGIE